MGVNFKPIRKGDAGELFDSIQAGPDGVVWIVCRVVDKGEHFSPEVHIQGASLLEKNAVAMCLDETYFVGPIPVDVILPAKMTTWTGLYFPLKK